jgi:nitronate monooxygenase
MLERLCLAMFQLSDLTVPIIQAPMAGGINLPELVAGVSNSGGLGSFGFAYSSPEKIQSDIQAARRLMKQVPQSRIHANFFIFQEPVLPSLSGCEAALKDLNEVLSPLGISAELPKQPFIPNLDAMLEPIWIERPDVLSFHFGLPSDGVIEKAHSLGIAVGVTATSLEEALQIQSAGADFIVAQGIEAGGHRGTFQADQAGLHDKKQTLKNLLADLKKHISLPLIAAGGIMNGQDVRQSIEWGAAAAQMGTAFLVANESGASLAHRRLILNHHDKKAVFTKAFSGRWAQGIHNKFIELMQEKIVLPFPIQNTMTSSMRRWATENDQSDYQSLWVGQAFTKSRAMPVKELMSLLNQEFLDSSPLSDQRRS